MRRRITMIICFLFFFIPLQACQGDRWVPLQGPQGQEMPAIYNANKLSNMDDVLEYQSLLHSCKMIKQNMKAIGDYRISLQDAIETSITLYLEGVKGPVAKILLEDIRKNGFNL